MKLYLIDISSFIFRAFYAIRSLNNSKGEPTNAIYGVAAMLFKLIEEAKPEYLCVTYDSKEPSFRKELFEEYKANRSEPPDDLIPQFERIDDLVRCMGLPAVRQNGVEADDLIATYTKKWLELSPKNEVVIVTGDKDLMQLVSPRVTTWDTMNNRVYDAEAVQEKFGVGPELIRDYLALVGDASDNIPGVSGIGPKTAVQLLNDFKSARGVLNAAKQGKVPGKKGETIAASEKDLELSLKLVALKEDVKTPVDPEKLKFKFVLKPECESFLTELEFNTLLNRWREKLGAANVAPTSVIEVPETVQVAAGREASGNWGPDAFRLINTESAMLECLEGIERTRQFGIDLETTSLNPRQAEIVGIALSYDSSFGCYIPLLHRGSAEAQLPTAHVLSLLKKVLEDPRYKKVGQNLKYDWSVLREQGVHMDGIGADTMVAAYVLDSNGRHNLEALCLKYLEYQVVTYETVCGRGKDQIGFDQVPIAQAVRYSAEDALCAVRLWEVLRPKLTSEKLMQVFSEIDLPLVQILGKMECQGISVDRKYLEALGKDFEKDLLAIEQKIQAFSAGPINLNSPKQLAQLLFDQLKLPPQGKTKTGYSTDASVLEALASQHEVPALLLEYREISKLKGTYIDPLPSMIDPKTGKIHAGFHQTVAATGRLSSSDPNLQNIPVRTERGAKIRRAFIPSPGNVLISADYSQIELRLLAHLSQDPELVAAFKQDADVHKRTAAEIFSISEKEVSPRQREIAKAINFGLMYGKSAFGLSQELKIPRKEAQEIIERYFKRYSAVKKLLDSQIREATEKGFVTTAFGRKRHLPDIHSRNPAVRGNAERMAMNTPIQGTAADLMKLAMISLDEALTQSGSKAKLVVQVHDEVLLDCPQDEVESTQKLVVKALETAMELSVPLKANSSVGENWQEL